MRLPPIHIVAGLIGLVSGAVALYAHKGANLHRRGGMIFFYAMMVLATTGTPTFRLRGSLLNQSSR